MRVSSAAASIRDTTCGTSCGVVITKKCDGMLSQSRRVSVECSLGIPQPPTDPKVFNELNQSGGDMQKI